MEKVILSNPGIYWVIDILINKRLERHIIRLSRFSYFKKRTINVWSFDITRLQ